MKGCFCSIDRLIFKKKEHTSIRKKLTEKKINHGGDPFMAQWLTNMTSIHEDAGLIPGLTQWVKDLVLP